jgi:acyl-CoA thioesterase-1
MSFISSRNIIFIVVVFATFSCSTSLEQQATKPETAVKEAGAKVDQKPIILFFGNSITAGYQLDLEEAFPALIQDRLDSLGFNYNVINAGLSGETTAAGVDRIDWVLRSIPEIFFLELGANDGLRGLPLSETKSNLKKIIDKVRKANPDVKIILAGMQVPPNLGKEYTMEFRTIFPLLASSENVELIPFLLDGVAGNPELNLADGIHPTAEGHKLLTETVWGFVQPLLTTKNL